MAGDKGPTFPRLPAIPTGSSAPRAFEENTAIHSTEDLDAILEQTKGAAPERQEFDDDHTAIASSLDLADRSMVVPDAPPAPVKPSANVVRRTNPAMPAVRASEPMAAVRASGSIPAMASAEVPATATDDELLDAAFADPMFDEPPAALAPAAPDAPDAPGAPDVLASDVLASDAPAPAPVVEAPSPEDDPWQSFDATPPPVDEAPGPAVEARAPSELASVAAPAPAPARGRGLLIGLILVLGVGAAAGMLGYDRVTRADQRAAAAERDQAAAQAAATEAARALATVKAELDALKSANVMLENKLAEQERAERERVEREQVERAGKRRR